MQLHSTVFKTVLTHKRKNVFCQPNKNKSMNSYYWNELKRKIKVSKIVEEEEAELSFTFFPRDFFPFHIRQDFN